LRHCFSGIDRLIHIDQGRLRRDVDPEELSEYTLSNLREWF
jgi:hypothetical protein